MHADEITLSTLRVAAEVAPARARAHAKHGANSIEALPSNDPRWLAVLGEEYGEVCHELTYDSTGDLRAELLDLVTVATAWIARIDEDSR